MDPTARVYFNFGCKSLYIKVVFDPAWRVISMLCAKRFYVIAPEIWWGLNRDIIECILKNSRFRTSKNSNC